MKILRKSQGICLGSKTRDRNEEQWSYGLTNKLDMAKKRISELEGTATETSKTDFFLLL
jgi:hypothetical protein